MITIVNKIHYCVYDCFIAVILVKKERLIADNVNYNDDNTVACSNCEFICGFFADDDVSLNAFRLTLDIPIMTLRICERSRPANKHKHNYEMRIATQKKKRTRFS